MTRKEKEVVVRSFSSMSEKYPCIIVVRQFGMSATLVSQLRKETRANGVSFKVFKNRLVKKALRGALDVLSPFFFGPTGIIFSDDPVSLSKFVLSFSKQREHMFAPTAGFLNGQLLSVEEIKKIASLPSLMQLRSHLLSLIRAPGDKVAALVQEPAHRIARLLNAYSLK